MTYRTVITNDKWLTNLLNSRTEKKWWKMIFGNKKMKADIQNMRDELRRVSSRLHECQQINNILSLKIAVIEATNCHVLKHKFYYPESGNSIYITQLQAEGYRLGGTCEYPRVDIWVKENDN